MWKVGTLVAFALASSWTLRAVAQTEPEHSVARIWNERLIGAIRTDIPKPPVHARNLFHVSVAMWDAWAHYDPIAEGYLYKEKSSLLAPASAPSGGQHFETAAQPTGLADFAPSENARAASAVTLCHCPPGNPTKCHTIAVGGPAVDAHVAHGDSVGACATTDVVKIYDPAVEAARAEAISFAAYRVLKYRFPTGTTCHPGAAAAQAAFDAQMDALGYDKTFTSTAGDSPAAVGNRIAAMVIAYGQADGANEGPTQCYPDNTAYHASNPNLIFKRPGNPSMAEPNHWQPLAFDFLVLQNGIIVGAAVQAFIGVGWGDVLPFGLTAADIPSQAPGLPCWTVPGVPQPYFDPGCPPQLGGVGDAQLKAAVLENIRFSSWTDPAQSPLIDASPASLGNNSLGADDGSGYPVNPVTGQIYAANMVNRADWVRVVAQSWSDGPQSETPPGHWNVLANEVVADNPSLVRKIGGLNPIVNALEWDVKVYLTLNGGMHDAAIGSWSTKNYYDSSRPISLIRYMAGLGQSSDPNQLSYHPNGLLLEQDLVEVITAESVQPGAKFESLKAFCSAIPAGTPATNVGRPCNTDDDCPDDGPYDGFCQSSVGKIAVHAWLGPPADAVNTTAGVGWRLAETWMPWFPNTFVTPPFPGYTSGHATFSRSGAEVMTAITGSAYFPGGIGTFDTLAYDYIKVEDGPTANLQLQWATYYDAADEAGISRRFGGIHPSYDDYPGRVMGSKIGQRAYARALQHFAPAATPNAVPAGQVEAANPPAPIEWPFKRVARAKRNSGW